MAIFAPPEPTTAAPARSLVGLTDLELVAEVRRGCDRAFEQLYERYHRRIAAYIFGMVNDYGRAEDIAQDVFMSALRRMRDTDRPIAFKPWVYEIAKNACIDQFRRARRGEEISYDAEEGLAAGDHGRLVAVGPAPDVAVDQKLALGHLCGAFGGLSQTHHDILVMRELEGLSYREIGERLGMSRPSVESTLFRARRRLGEEYEELVSGERCVRIQTIIAAAGAAVPGARDQRRLAAHLSHCQPCRRHARVAGLDAAALVVAGGARAKIAALIPLPAFLRRRWFGEEVVPITSNHHVSSLAQLSAQLGSSVDPAIASWAKAAAAAATLAVAGVAGGAAVSEERRAGSGRSASEAPRATATPGNAGPAARSSATVPDSRERRPALGVPRPERPAVGAQIPASAAPEPSLPSGAAGSSPPSSVAGTGIPTAPAAGPISPPLDPARNPTGRPGPDAGASTFAAAAGNAGAAADTTAGDVAPVTKAQLEGTAEAAVDPVAKAATGSLSAVDGR